MVWTCSKNGRGKIAKRRDEMVSTRKLTWVEGIRGLMGEKGLMEEDWNGRGNWRKKIM
jgi:hypothetical protein